MVEKNHPYTLTDDKIMEKVIEDDHVAIAHLVMRTGDSTPAHPANSNVTFIVVRGEASMKLDEQELKTYPKGSIVSIPFRTMMQISNQSDEILEAFVVKAPSPKSMQGM